MITSLFLISLWTARNELPARRRLRFQQKLPSSLLIGIIFSSISLSFRGGGRKSNLDDRRIFFLRQISVTLKNTNWEEEEEKNEQVISKMINKLDFQLKRRAGNSKMLLGLYKRSDL